jgi:LysM repeat protein
MTLASQSYRSQQRRSTMSSSRPLVSKRAAVLGGLVAVIAGGTLWLLRPPAAPPSAESAGGIEGERIAGARGDTDDRIPGGGASPEPARPSGGSGTTLGANAGSTGREQSPTTLREIVARNERLAAPAEDAPAFTMAPRGGPTNPTPTPPAPTPPAPAVTPSEEPPPGVRSASPDRPAESKPAAPITPPPSAQPTPPAQLAQPGSSNPELSRAMRLAASDPVAARVLATRAIDSGALSPADRMRAYDLLNGLARQLFFNANVNPNDPTMVVYTVRSGDNLQKIVREQQLGCDHRLIQRINGIADPRKLRVGQRLRLPKGDFHAEVIKSEYRLNLYLGEGSDRVLISSFRVGLGESNGTPTGLFKVRPNSKLIDPEWTHPRTGQHFRSNDPMNPIGEHWIGLVGVEESTRGFLGYGIHGTIEPDSIGQDRSLGCVRLLADDVAIVYECLTEPNSTVVIR